MRAVLQRVSSASVTVERMITGSIGTGLVVLLGITHGDTPADADFLLDTIVHLRVFADEAGKMNPSVADAGGALLVVSPFTLYGECRTGRRPSSYSAAPA